MIPFFQNIKYIESPSFDECVLFSCDQQYFEKYGVYNALSCSMVGHNVHIHIINPDSNITDTYIEIKNKIKTKISLSIEYVDLDQLNFYQLKTYYYCSRFFVANDIFEKFKIELQYITDADVFFNKKVTFDNDLGVIFFPEKKNLWKRTSATLMIIRKNKIEFLKKIINEYNRRFTLTDFTILDTLTDKHQRGEILGLDQVCMSASLDEFIDCNFTNLNNVSGLISKNEFESSIWNILKYKKDPSIITKLKAKVKQ